MPRSCLLLRGYRVDGVFMPKLHSRPEWRWWPSQGLPLEVQLGRRPITLDELEQLARGAA
jgi:hypothetical protein